MNVSPFPRVRRLMSRVEQRWARSRAQDGPYRFLVRDWNAISDARLAAQVIETEFFKNEMTPVALPIQRFSRILLIAPHQDDETIGAGGTLLLASDNRAEITVLYATDGSQPGAPNMTAESSVETRRREARVVCDSLGARMEELGISNAQISPTIAHVDRLASTIQRVSPDVMFVPWLLDGAPKHRFLNHLLWLAQRRHNLPDCEVLGYQVHNTPYPNAVVDITDVADRKRDLLKTFRSQNDHLFAYDHVAMGMAAWNSRFLPYGPRRRYAELFCALPLVEHLEMIEKYYFRDLEVTYQGHAGVLPGMKELHAVVVGGGGAT